MESKTRTALPRPRNNAFARGSPLVRPGNLHLLSELPADLPTKLFAKANRVQLAAGKILFREGAIGDGCYRIEDGLLKVTMVSNSGAERILQFLGPNSIVGELSTIDGLLRSATVVVVRDATLSSVSRAEFEAFAEEHPEVYKSLVKLLAHRLRDTDAVVAASSFLSLRGRVARTVLELRARGRARSDRHPSEDRAERPCRHGGHRTRESDPGPQRLAAPQITEPLVWLLLP